MTITQVYKSLEKKLGEETAENLTAFITEDVKEKFSVQKEFLATKKDLAETKTDLIKWVVAIAATQTATILGFLYFMLNKH